MKGGAAVPEEAKRYLNQLFMDEADRKSPEYHLLAKFCSVDTKHIPNSEKYDFFRQLINSVRFLGFFEGKQLETKTKDGKPRTYLDVFGDVLAEKLSMTDDDRDLVIMRH